MKPSPILITGGRHRKPRSEPSRRRSPANWKPGYRGGTGYCRVALVGS